jgi:hypothetical protein
MQGNAVENSKALCGSICESSFALTRSLFYLHLLEGSISFSHFLVHTLTPMYISKNIKTYLSSLSWLVVMIYSSLSKGDWFCAQLVCRQIILLASIVFPLDQDCMFQIWSDLSFQSRLDFSVVVASFGTKRRRRRQLQKILFIQSCKP